MFASAPTPGPGEPNVEAQGGAPDSPAASHDSPQGGDHDNHGPGIAPSH